MGVMGESNADALFTTWSTVDEEIQLEVELELVAEEYRAVDDEALKSRGTTRSDV